MGTMEEITKEDVMRLRWSAERFLANPNVSEQYKSATRSLLHACRCWQSEIDCHDPVCGAGHIHILRGAKKAER
jgi:hypothetical protein